jgi:asparagine synthase (glutamine-hydrolysing)
MQAEIVIEVEKYWDIDVEEQDEKISDEDAIEKFKGLFETSVKRRLRSDVPLGTSLSGGLDSSSIAATISQLQTKKNKLQTFSAIFPGFEKNEEKYIDEVTNHFSLQSFKTIVNNEEIPRLFQTIIKQQDEPFGSAGTLPQYKVFELAKQSNVKVLLDGQGADEILAGYHKYYKWYWQELFRKRKLIGSGELEKHMKLELMKNLRLKISLLRFSRFRVRFFGAAVFVARVKTGRSFKRICSPAKQGSLLHSSCDLHAQWCFIF